MLRLGLLEVAPGKFATVQVTEAGRAALRDRTPITLTKQLDKPEPKGKQRAGAIECDETLFAELRGVRRELADARNVPAYVIFSDVALREMARSYPTTAADFRRIPGVGEQKLKDFAEPFLRAIANYLDSNARQSLLSAKDARTRRISLNESEAESCAVLKRANQSTRSRGERGFVRGRFSGHLALAIENAADLTSAQFFTPVQEQEIAAAIERSGGRNLTALRDDLGGRFEIGELRIYRALAAQGRRGTGRPTGCAALVSPPAQRFHRNLITFSNRLSIGFVRRAFHTVFVDESRVVEQHNAVMPSHEMRADTGEHVEQPHGHGHAAGAVLPHLTERRSRDAFEISGIGDDPKVIRVVVAPARRNFSTRHLDEPGAEPFDAGDGGERIVDSRRQGTHGDFDQLIDRVFGILHRSAMAAKEDGIENFFAELVVETFLRHDFGENFAICQEIARPAAEPNHHVGLHSGLEKRFHIDRLDVTAPTRTDQTAVLPKLLRDFPRIVAVVRRRPAGFLGKKPVEIALQFVCHAADDVLGNDRSRDVMDEENQKPDAHYAEENAAGDGEKGTTVTASIPRIARSTSKQ